MVEFFFLSSSLRVSRAEPLLVQSSASELHPRPTSPSFLLSRAQTFAKHRLTVSARDPRRRVKEPGVEEDIAEERLQFWINRIGQSPTSHDAVDVERGLLELRKLGIEQQLWEASRKEIDQALSVANHKPYKTNSEISS